MSILNTPSRLSPSKKAPFLTPSDAKKPVESVRRPSGYFAQRKSLAPAQPIVPPNDVGRGKSPKKVGRMSLGNHNASTRFDVDAEKERAQREKEAREQRGKSSILARVSPTSQPAPPAIDQYEDTDIQIVNPAAQWRENIQEQSFLEDDGPPSPSNNSSI